MEEVTAFAGEDYPLVIARYAANVDVITLRQGGQEIKISGEEFHDFWETVSQVLE